MKNGIGKTAYTIISQIFAGEADNGLYVPALLPGVLNVGIKTVGTVNGSP